MSIFLPAVRIQKPVYQHSDWIEEKRGSVAQNYVLWYHKKAAFWSDVLFWASLTDFDLITKFLELFCPQNPSQRCYVCGQLLLNLKACQVSALPIIKFQMDRMIFRVLSGYNCYYMNHDDLLNILCLLLPPICLKIQQDASCAGLLFLLWSWILLLWKCTTESRFGLSPRKYDTETKICETGRYVSASLYHLNTRPQWAASFSAFCTKIIATALLYLLFGCHCCNIYQQILSWNVFHKALCFFSFSSPEPLTGEDISATSLLEPAGVSKTNNRLYHILFCRRLKPPDAATYVCSSSILYTWSSKPGLSNLWPLLLLHLSAKPEWKNSCLCPLGIAGVTQIYY
jgi:hypothetical protein